MKESIAEGVFGSPGTDAASVAIACASDAPDVKLEFFAPPVLTQDGVEVRVALPRPRGTLEFPAAWSNVGRPIVHIGPRKVNVLRISKGAATIGIAVDGHSAGRFVGLGSSDKTQAFFARCPLLQ